MATKAELNVEAGRELLAEALSLVLADTYALYLKTQNYHWNVKGACFPELHLMFETQYRELAEAVDLIAERIRTLGYKVSATFAEFSKQTCVQEGDGTLPASEMVHGLGYDHERVAQALHAILPKAEKAHDYATVELLTQRMVVHEKFAWMLRSSQEE